MNNWKNHPQRDIIWKIHLILKYNLLEYIQSEKIIEMACEIIQSRLNEIKESIKKGTLKIKLKK